MSLSTNSFNGPRWEVESEYPNPDSPQVDADLNQVTSLVDKMEPLSADLTQNQDAATAQTLRKLADETGILLRNLHTYANCLLSVNGKDESAQKLMARLQNYDKLFAERVEALSAFCDTATEEQIIVFLDDPEVIPWEFQVRQARQKAHERLSLQEEKLSHALAQDGISAWGQLYDRLSGTIQCTLMVDGQRKELGIAETTGLLENQDESIRQSAWTAINTSFETHEESFAAGLNAIAGWRLEMNRKRSHNKKVHFLDAPTHQNRIDRRILDTLLDVAKRYRPMAQRAARLRAKALGKNALGPWDHRAPPPSLGESKASPAIPYEQAIELIAQAYHEIDPAMGEFVRMMDDNAWIEGSVSPTKRPGAYCTGFAKSRTPRVYMTYTGGPSNVITLAHELGHAFHGWVMRDLPLAQKSYGMSLAETASTLGESVVRHAMLKNATCAQTKFDILWAETGALVTFLLNIPMRFTFEKNFYDARQQRAQRPQELKQLMCQAWKDWYQDTMSEPDPMLWATKLHFYIPELSFYNFPYLFGYLFSLGVYAKRQHYGESFFGRYRALLEDTGRMTANDLARKHLDVDLTQPHFWEESLKSIEAQLDAFDAMLSTHNC
jgi:oligoendopeptidase F